jgi:DNA-binding GntR family transcriptional regulator
VAHLTLQDQRDIFPIMSRLEGWVAHEVAGHATPEELARLGALHDRLERLAAAGDASRYWDVNYDFHLAMQAMAGNRWLQEILGGLRGKLNLARHRSLKLPGRLEASLAEHRALMRALRRRRPDEAEAVMRRHLSSQLDAIVELEGAAGEDGAARPPPRSRPPAAAGRHAPPTDRRPAGSSSQEAP